VIVDWLDAGMRGEGPDAEIIKKCVKEIHHSSLQAKEPGNEYLATQMPNGHGPVFALTLHSPAMAKTLPSFLHYFHHATSLGGVESLVEWRAMSDETVDRALVRFSIGVEAAEDLKGDLQEGLKKLCDKF
jgi:cystathionine gamma-synthase